MLPKSYYTWCLCVTPHILNIPDIPKINAMPTVPDIPDIPIYYHPKSGFPTSKIGQNIAIFIKCAKFVTEEQQHILPL